MVSPRISMSSPAGAVVVVDANIAIAISSNEMGRAVKANSELQNYTSQGYSIYAPGVLISETLYVLCLKLHAGILTPAEYSQAILDFQQFMKNVLPPPSGDSALIPRASAIGSGYGCSRS